MVECACFENMYARKGIGGSNPPASAIANSDTKHGIRIRRLGGEWRDGKFILRIIKKYVKINESSILQFKY